MKQNEISEALCFRIDRSNVLVSFHVPVNVFRITTSFPRNCRKYYIINKVY